MKNKIDVHTLIRFSKGKYSYNEYLKVKNWFNKVDENQAIKDQLFAQWEKLNEGKSGSDDSLHHIFEKVQYTILLEEKKNSKKVFIWNFYRQAAAILIIPVLAFSLWFYTTTRPTQHINQAQHINQSWAEINAPEGARVEFLLPDSSRGWLNAGSKLKYPVAFNTNRKVELVGEAYFDVKHQKLSEFIVSVNDMDVHVHGTKFNVSAYVDDTFTDVVLKEGKVEIRGKTGKFNQMLLPDEKISFNRGTKSLNQIEVDANRFMAWKDGFLIIDNETLGEVTKRLERWYNADFIIVDEVLKNYRFKATFQDEPLDEVLRLIAKTTPIHYTIKKRKVDSDGIMEQKEVTLTLK